MATAEQKGKRPRIEAEEGDRIDDALLLSIEKLQEIQDEIERVSRFVSRQLTAVAARSGCSAFGFGAVLFIPEQFARRLRGI